MPTKENNTNRATACHFIPLKGYGAFETVFTHGSRFAYRGVTGFILFRSTIENASSNASQTKAAEFARFAALPANAVALGVTAKRRTRSAAMRNRIKRILRAGAREALRATPSFCSPDSNDGAALAAAIVLVCNIVPAKPSLLHLRDIQPLIERIFNNVIRYSISSRNHRSAETSEQTL
jgi:ribonuclease P protein component